MLYVFRLQFCVFFQAEDGIRDLVRSRGLGDVYKRQALAFVDGDIVAAAKGIKAFAKANPALVVKAGYMLSLIHI